MELQSGFARLRGRSSLSSLTLVAAATLSPTISCADDDHLTVSSAMVPLVTMETGCHQALLGVGIRRRLWLRQLPVAPPL